MFTVSNDEICIFLESGYLKLSSISPPGEIARMRKIYDELFAELAAKHDANQFDLASRERTDGRPVLPQVLDPGAFRPELRETEAWKNAGEILRSLLGTEPDFRGDHAILKPAGYGAATPWHQDEAYWDPAFSHNTLSIWMPLQDVDEESGCLSFVPGSHRFDVLQHRPIGNDPLVHGLELASPNDVVSEAISVPLKAGECTVHMQRTLHFAPPNTAAFPRRAYIMMGGLQGTPLESPRQFDWQERQRAAGAPASG